MAETVYGPGSPRPAGLEREFWPDIVVDGVQRNGDSVNGFYAKSIIGKVLQAGGEYRNDFGAIGRCYVDGSLPEISLNERTDYLALSYSQTGADDMIAHATAELLTEIEASYVRPVTVRAQVPITSTDGQHYWGGVHTNMAISRTTFDEIFSTGANRSELLCETDNPATNQLATYLVVSALIMGSGSIKRDYNGQEPGSTAKVFKVHPFERLHAMQVLVSDTSTSNRPILNNRDEPHANRGRHARLHIITQDPKIHPVETFLDVACLSAMLRTIETRTPIPYWFSNPLHALKNLQQDANVLSRVTNNNGDILYMSGREVFTHIIRHILANSIKEGFPDQEQAALKMVDEGLKRFQEGDTASKCVLTVHPWLRVQQYLTNKGLVGVDLSKDDQSDLWQQASEFNTYTIKPGKVTMGGFMAQARTPKVLQKGRQAAVTLPTDTRAAQRYNEFTSIPLDKIIRVNWNYLSKKSASGSPSSIEWPNILA